MADTIHRIKGISLFIRQALGLSLLLPAAAMAVSPPPGAGTLDNQLRQSTAPVVQLPSLTTPALSLPADAPGQARALADNGPRVTLRQIRLTGEMPAGMARVPSADVNRLVTPLLGKPVSFARLQELTLQLTTLFREHGTLLARVIIPPQTARDGVLTLQLIPGKYDTARLQNAAPVRDSVLARVVQAQAPEGNIITRQKLERLSLLVNEIPGVQGDVSLRTGARPGTAAVDVSTRPAQRYGGYLGLDNLGSPVTGRARLFGGGYVNGLFLYGDQLRLDGSVSYEHGGLTNGLIDYSLLADGYGTRVGASYSRLDYQYDFLKHTFRGYADNWEAYVSHPLIRTAGAQVNVRLAAGQSFLTDKYPAIFTPLGKEGHKTINTGVAGIAGSFASLPGGVTGVSLDLTRGDVHYRDEGARFWNSSDLRDTEGSFTTLNWQLQHDQHIWGPVSLLTRARGQVADRNLDASRKLMLGGPSSVRAYDVGDGSVDTGAVLTAELRTTWGLPSRSWTGKAPSLTLAGFYDQGWGEQNRDNALQNGGVLADKNRVNLAGAGVSMTLEDPGNYALTATWARRTTGSDPVSGNRDSDRIWLSAMKTF